MKFVKQDYEERERRKERERKRERERVYKGMECLKQQLESKTSFFPSLSFRIFSFENIFSSCLFHGTKCFTYHRQRMYKKEELREKEKLGKEKRERERKKRENGRKLRLLIE